MKLSWIKKTLALCIMICLILSTFAASGLKIEPKKIQLSSKSTPVQQMRSEESWNKTYGGSSKDIGYCIRQTKDGGFIIVGETSSFGAGGSDVWLIKTNNQGALLWDKTFGGKNNDVGYSVQQTTDNGFIIVGTTRSIHFADSFIWLIKTNETGVEQWNQTYKLSDENIGKSVQQSSNGGYIITGTTGTFTAKGFLYTTPFLLKTNADGASQWQTTYGNGERAYQYGESVIPTSGNEYLITGSSHNNNPKLWFLKADSTGKKIWQGWTLFGWEQSYGRCIIQTSDGGYAIVGYATNNMLFGENLIFTRVKADGGILWEKYYEYPYHYSSKGFGLFETPENGFILVGQTTAYTGANDITSDIWVIQTDKNGNLTNDQTFGKPGYSDVGYYITPTTDAGYILIGSTESSDVGDTDIWVIKSASSTRGSGQITAVEKTVKEIEQRTSIESSKTQGLPAFDQKDIQPSRSTPAPTIPNPVKKNTYSTPLSNTSYVPGELIVKYKPSQSTKGQHTLENYATSQSNVQKKHHVLSMQPVFSAHSEQDALSDLSNVYKIILSPEEDLLSALQEYQDDPTVEYAQLNYLMQPCDVPDDPFYSSAGSWRNFGQSYADQYPLHVMNAKDAWDITSGNHEVIVAVLDSGVDYTHPDITENMWTNPDEIPGNDIDDDHDGYIDNLYGADIINTDGDPMDDHYHGTFCAGIIGATGDNHIGISGVSPHVSIMAVKAFPKRGDAPSDILAAGTIWATDNGARVISNSWGPGGILFRNPIVEDAIRYAYHHGVVSVFAAGNSDGGNDVKYFSPMNMEEVITVAATNQPSTDPMYGVNTRFYYSNYGPGVDVCAPGVNILSLLSKNSGLSFVSDYYGVVDNMYYRTSGTSAAAPQVAGLIALMLSKNSSLSIEMITTILKASVDPVNTVEGEYIGTGRINASQALQRTLAIASITKPMSWPDASGLLCLQGSAWGEEFLYYTIEYKKTTSSTTPWTLFTNSSLPVLNNTLATIDTHSLDERQYLFRLHVVCNDGYYDDILSLVVNNRHNEVLVDDTGDPGVYFTSLQNAIDNAGTADTVRVYNGMYSKPIEWIWIEKSITLLSNDAPSSTHINAYGLIVLETHNVTITGFNLSTGYINVWVSSSHHVTITNNILSYGYGIYLQNSDENIITRNIAGTPPSRDVYCGVYAKNSHENIISNNTIYSYSYGIVLDKSSNNIVHDNYLWDTGLLVIGSSLSHFIHDVNTNNTLKTGRLYYLVEKSHEELPSDAGQVILVNSSQCHLSHLTFEDIWYDPITLVYSTENTIDNITISNSPNGIVVLSSSYNIFSNNRIARCENAFYLFESQNDFLLQNTITQCQYGITLKSSQHTTLLNNTLMNNSVVGLFMISSNGTIHKNKVSLSHWGLYITESSSVIITQNTLEDNIIGIEFFKTQYNTLHGNILNNGGLLLSSRQESTQESKQDFIHTIDETNIIDSRPLYYYRDQHSLTVPSNAGMVILVNCTGFDISGITLPGGTIALELAYCSNINLSNNTLGSMLVISSQELSVTHNTFVNCRFGGITFYRSSDNTIAHNIIRNSQSITGYKCGAIVLSNSSESTIEYNQIYNVDCLYGISLESHSQRNLISHNDIRDNDQIYAIILSYYSQNNTIQKNTLVNTIATYGWAMVFFLKCSDNIFEENLIKNYTRAGVIINECASNILRKNTITDSRLGIYLIESMNNHIYQNNLLKNSDTNAFDNNPDPLNQQFGRNYYENGYSDGGNYWDDYFGSDNYSGPNQNISGSDGIGDTPYRFRVDATQEWKYDFYPIYNPSQQAKPDLTAAGSLGWSRVKPGAVLTGEFTVQNIGEAHSRLNWEIESFPDWGTWTFSTSSGMLLAENGPFPIYVSVVAPTKRHTNFTGRIKIINSDNVSDFEVIHVYLKTKLTTQEVPSMLQMILHRLFDRFPFLEKFLLSFPTKY